MSIQKPSIPKGTRDFSPVEMVRRNYIFDTIKGVFQRYGYLPIETPAMENLSTLMGKYGEEGDKLVFKILNSGNYTENIHNVIKDEKDETYIHDDQYIQEIKFTLAEKEFLDSIIGKTYNDILELINNIHPNKFTRAISEKGLRYDLTVPFARYVVQHRNDITFPFKRYQIQPVWRADKPQRGRYREFFQCDVDVIGSNSLLNEVELIQIIDEVFKKLNVSVTIKLNNRKILYGIAEVFNMSERFIDFTTVLDKLEKSNIESIKNEYLQKGCLTDFAEKFSVFITKITSKDKTRMQKINELKTSLCNSPIGLKGIAEIEEIYEYFRRLFLGNKFSIDNTLDFDFTLARGLNYYTGTIIEVKANDVEMGSICGGGRYDNLTGIFGLSDVSGVGVSFGADRIYDVMNELNLFPENTKATTQVMFVNVEDNDAKHYLPMLAEIRNAGINAELYPEQAKTENQRKRQIAYANKMNIPYIVFMHDNENEITVGDMKKDKREKMKIEELIKLLK